MAGISKDDFPEHIRSGVVITENKYVFPLITRPQYLPELKKLEVRPTDIFILTWPKSGTTWMQYIVSHIVKGTKFVNEQNLFLFCTFLECAEYLENVETSPGMYEKIEGIPSPRFFKSHLLTPLLPTQIFEKKPKVIYVARNPKDTAVSYFHFCESNIHLPAYNTWKEFFHYFCKGLLPYGDYFDHVLPWWEKRNEPNVLFVKYEDMKKDPKGTIVRLSAFLERTLTEEEVEDISFNTSFTEMKKNKYANPDLHDIGIIRRKDKPNATLFMRKGQVGDWKNYFTVTQNEQFDKIYESKMAGTGLTFDFI